MDGWEDQFKRLDLRKVRALIYVRATQLGLLGKCTIDEILVDALYLSWEKFPQWDPEKASFQTWVHWLAKSVMVSLKRASAKQVQLETWMVDPAPDLLEMLIRREEILEAEERVKRIEMAVRSASELSAVTDLRVFKAYLEVLRKGEKPTSRRVAQEAGLSHTAVTNALKRMAARCQKAGISL